MDARTYCNGRHKMVVPERSAPHPAVTMSRSRADAWERFATDEEFYQWLESMANIYAKRHYAGDGTIDQDVLFKDYKKWRDDFANRAQL